MRSVKNVTYFSKSYFTFLNLLKLLLVKQFLFKAVLYSEKSMVEVILSLPPVSNYEVGGNKVN